MSPNPSDLLPPANSQTVTIDPSEKGVAAQVLV